MRGQFVDLTGKRFGRLTVLYRADDYISPKGVKVVRYHCRCDCGNESDVQAGGLRNGTTQSCGCIQRDLMKSGVNSRKHGMKKTRIYRIWENIHDRCYRERNPRFPQYGGRGIKMCQEWQGKNGFVTFYEWAINNGYNDKLSIDRINNDKGYYPDNCRWADNKTQANNKSTSKIIEVDGTSKTVAEWIADLGLTRNLYKKSCEAATEIIRKRLAEKQT